MDKQPRIASSTVACFSLEVGSISGLSDSLGFGAEVRDFCFWQSQPERPFGFEHAAQRHIEWSRRVPFLMVPLLFAIDTQAAQIEISTPVETFSNPATQTNCGVQRIGS